MVKFVEIGLIIVKSQSENVDYRHINNEECCCLEGEEVVHRNLVLHNAGVDAG